MSEMKKALDIAPQTLYSAARRLKELNLVFENNERGFPRKVYLNLTREGKKVAESLTQANEVVSDTIGGYKKKLGLLRKRKKNKGTKDEIMELLCRLGEISFAQGRWNEALDHCNECNLLAKELGNAHHEGRSALIMAEVHSRRGQGNFAQRLLERCSELFSQLEDSGNLSRVHYTLGTMSEEKGDFDKALSEYQKSESYAKEADYDIYRGKAMLGAGRILGKKGHYGKSYRDMIKAIRVLEGNDALEELPLGYANLGATSFFLDNDEAIEWHEKSVSAAEEVGALRMIGCGRMNIAGCLIKKSDHDLALKNLEEALGVITEIDDKEMLSSLHIQFGITYRAQRRWTAARESLGRAVDISKEVDMPYNLADALLNLALLDLDTSSPDRAKMRLTKAMIIFKDLGNAEKVSEIQKYLDEISS
jgi:tetratricopeptide (TPR) repeat protein